MNFEQIFLAARVELMRYALSLCHRREEAEDLVQTAFVRVWERAEQMQERGEDACRGYLFRVVRNAYIDRMRKLGPETPADCAPEESRWDDLSGPDAEALLQSLPLSIRQTVALKCEENLNCAELALRLGIPAATVRTRLRAARLYLKKRREEHETSHL